MKHVYTQPYVVVSGLIIDDDDKILLVKENHRPDKGKWNLPGGKLQLAEDPQDAVIREVKEETGLDFIPKSIAGIHSIYRKDVANSSDLHVIKIVFCGSAKGTINNDQNEIINGEQEIAQQKWLKAKSILAMEDRRLRYHDTKACIIKVLSDEMLPLNLINHIVQDANPN
jgi:ADP-ribose pyrophosphatase YjhB (NUDIX family)